MGESYLGLVRGHPMAQQKRDEIRAQVQSWLIDEGYKVSIEDNPKTYYTIIAEHPTKMHIVVSQALDSKDRLTIEGGLQIPDQFRKLPETERLDVLWDIRYGLVNNEISFVMLPNGRLPERIVLLKNIWYDGLTKNSLMNTAQKVVEGKLMTLWKIQRKLGAPEPKDNMVV